jgi:hypothetical protein
MSQEARWFGNITIESKVDNMFFNLSTMGSKKHALNHERSYLKINHMIKLFLGPNIVLQIHVQC